MRRVLKDTGSIYLHCDPTASHYLKLLMDAIFGRKNFRNEIVWCYTGPGSPGMRQFNRKHDIIFWYNFGKIWKFNRDDIRIPHKRLNLNRSGAMIGDALTEELRDAYLEKGKIPETWWPNFTPVGRIRTEKMGYPTQKPLALLERIIRASSNEGDTVLDPFCGCGTTVHAAESLHRKWIGIDISKFSTGLIRDRILHNFKYLNTDDIDLRGTPDSVAEARKLARQDPFEFEKWVCGYIGAEGMFREPGEKGADGGVDGVLKFFPVREGKKVKPEYAIVQVKGGNVSPDAVKALHETVRRYEATAGVMVCFADQLGTVENQRVKATFSDAWGSYPVVQGFSVESLLSDGQLDLPLYGYKRRGAMLGL
ncbi:MAG: DNA methyltransferase [Chloroflexota bacterium]|nr:DNA methyltransferase [Chloroflexota bacterium]MDE2946803.1 DNA methyltransferase [Chloroflexota bacterium]